MTHGAYVGLRQEVTAQPLGGPAGMVLLLSDDTVAHRHLEARTSVGKTLLERWP